MNHHSNFIHYIVAPNGKQPKRTSTGEWISKLYYIQLGCSTKIEKNKPLTHTVSNTDDSQTHNAEQKKLDTKENILYDTIYI